MLEKEETNKREKSRTFYTSPRPQHLQLWYHTYPKESRSLDNNVSTQSKLQHQEPYFLRCLSRVLPFLRVLKTSASAMGDTPASQAEGGSVEG